MSLKTKSSQASIANLLLLSFALTGSICLWSDRETQTKTIQVNPTAKSTAKLENPIL